MKKILTPILVAGLMLNCVNISVGLNKNFEKKNLSEDDIDRWAVIIGISDYKGGENDLDAPAKEAQALYDTLQEKDSRWQSSNMLLLKNKGAKKQDILDALDWLKTNVDSGDIVLFSFNGHGGYIKDTNGDEFDGRDECIVAWEGSNGFITDDLLNSKFSEISKKNTRGMFVIFDCCLSGGLFSWRRKIIDTPYEILNKETINIINKEISKANNFTTQLTADMSLNNRVIVASSIPHGLAVELKGEEGWFDFTTGLRKAMDKGMKTAEDISRYAKLWWITSEEFLGLFTDPFFWILNFIYLIDQGVIIMPIPVIKDGYPVLHPRVGKLWILDIFGGNGKIPCQTSNLEDSGKSSPRSLNNHNAQDNQLFQQII